MSRILDETRSRSFVVTLVGFVELKYYSEANVGGQLLEITRKHVLTHECQ